MCPINLSTIRLNYVFHIKWISLIKMCPINLSAITFNSVFHRERISLIEPYLIICL